LLPNRTVFPWNRPRLALPHTKLLIDFGSFSTFALVVVDIYYCSFIFVIVYCYL